MLTPSEPCGLCGGLGALWCIGCAHWVCAECDLDGLLWEFPFKHRVEDHQEEFWQPGEDW